MPNIFDVPNDCCCGRAQVRCHTHTERETQPNHLARCAAVMAGCQRLQTAFVSAIKDDRVAIHGPGQELTNAPGGAGDLKA